MSLVAKIFKDFVSGKIELVTCSVNTTWTWLYRSLKKLSTKISVTEKIPTWHIKAKIVREYVLPQLILTSYDIVDFIALKRIFGQQYDLFVNMKNNVSSTSLFFKYWGFYSDVEYLWIFIPSKVYFAFVQNLPRLLISCLSDIIVLNLIIDIMVFENSVYRG